MAGNVRFQHRGAIYDLMNQGDRREAAMGRRGTWVSCCNPVGKAGSLHLPINACSEYDNLINPLRGCQTLTWSERISSFRVSAFGAASLLANG